MARRHSSDTGPRLMRLGNDPQLLFHTPAPPPFACADDLDRAVRHRSKGDLTVDFKVASFGMPAASKARRGSPDAYQGECPRMGAVWELFVQCAMNTRVSML